MQTKLEEAYLMECHETMLLNDLYVLDDNAFEDKYQCKYPELVVHKPLTVRDWLKVKNPDGTLRNVSNVLKDLSNHIWTDELISITELSQLGDPVKNPYTERYNFNNPDSIWDFILTINKEK